jgi:O-antigen/teichoic acid export membrane protein
MQNKIFLKIGYNTLIQIFGKGIAALLGLFTVALLTRYLGTGGYGNFTLVFAYLSFFSIIADLGLQVVIIREIAHKSNNEQQLYGTFFWLKLLLIIISTFFAIIFLFFFPYSFMQKIAIVIGSLAVGLSSLNGFGVAIFQAKLRLDLITLTDILSRVVNTLFIILFIHLKFNFYSIVFTVFLGNIAGSFLILLVLKKMRVFHFRFDKNYAKKLLMMAIPIGISLFFSTLYFKLDTVMLSVMRNMHEVGVYSLSYKILENIIVLWSFYMATLYPILSRYKANGNEKSYKKMIKVSVIILLVASSTIITICYFFAPFLISLLGGNNFSESILSFKILLFSIPVFFATNLFYFINLIKGRSKLLVFALSFSLIINFLLNLFFIPKLGYIGASYTTLITECLLLIFYLFI